MYQYSEYFDIVKKGLPYGSPNEELEDYLRLLDMVLESYLDHKGLGKKEKLFSSGLVITESEIESYFERPPYFRERDVGDPETAGSAENAFEYIEERVHLTEQSGGAVRLPEEDDGDLYLGSKTDSPDQDEAPDQFPAPPESTAAENGPAEPGERLRIEPIRKLFDLDRTQLLAVILALAPEIDRRYERMYGFLQDNIIRRRPTEGLLHAIVSRITLRVGPQAVLPVSLPDKMFTWFFKSTEEPRSLDTELVLNPLMKRVLLGIPEPEGSGTDTYYEYTEEEIPLFFENSGKELEFALSGGQNAFCYLESVDEETVMHLLYRYCADHGERLYVVNLSELCELSGEDGSAVISELLLKVKLQDGRLCIRYLTGDEKESGKVKEEALRRWKILKLLSAPLEGECIAIYGEKEEPGELIVQNVPFLRIPMPDVSLRMRIWEHFMQEADGIGLSEEIRLPDLADCYDISYGTIKNTCSHARGAARIRRESSISRSVILESLRQLNQVDFSGLATYVRPAYRWEDITITDAQREVLKVACNRYRLRNRIGMEWGLTRKNAYGNGVSLLLYGPPGTGKTMAAQVVANELGLPLYRVDLSQIFSKYIGETEKNLSLVFDAAKGANVILFFDEADALFSKRTEINNSNDKYSNSETAFLLQKIEEYDGMSLLATNNYNNFDTAFVRRITYTVRFDSPDEEARYALWTTILPKETKVSEALDFRFFAKRFELSGSNIKSILYSAAYMAGAEGMPVGPEHIVRAIELEYQKLGRFIDPGAFGPYAKYLRTRGQQNG